VIPFFEGDYVEEATLYFVVGFLTSLLQS